LVLQGQNHAANGDVPAARASYLKALEIQPDDRCTRQLLAVLDAD
jgi:Flp pilus assembly protein TadD